MCLVLTHLFFVGNYICAPSVQFPQKFFMLSFDPFKQFSLLYPLSLYTCMRAFNLSGQIFSRSTSIITRTFSVSSSSRNRSCQQTYRRWHTSIVNSQSLHVVKAKHDKRRYRCTQVRSGRRRIEILIYGRIYDPESLRSSRVIQEEAVGKFYSKRNC